MDIGPINPVRPVVRPSPPGYGSDSDSTADLRSVFAAEFRNQQPDDSYSPARKASRGLEDEDIEEDFTEPDSPHSSDSPGATINFFA